MAAKASDAIALARSLIGTPYSELDCIGLIRKVIREAPGGVRDYTTAGTNTLWNSFDSAAKYRDLTFRQEGLAGAKPGMLAFKRTGDDVHHVGLVTDAGTVVHSSSAQGGRGVVETPLTAREGWTQLAAHRYILIGEAEQMGEKATVKTAGGKLNVRDMPDGRVIGQLENGSEIEITGGEGDWLRIHFGEARSGYVFAAYVSRQAKKKKRMRIIDEAGDIYDIEGAFTVRMIEDGND